MTKKIKIVRFERKSVLDYDPPDPTELLLVALDEKGEEHQLVLKDEAIFHLVDLARQIDSELKGAFKLQ